MTNYPDKRNVKSIKSKGPPPEVRLLIAFAFPAIYNLLITAQQQQQQCARFLKISRRQPAPLRPLPPTPHPLARGKDSFPCCYFAWIWYGDRATRAFTPQPPSLLPSTPPPPAQQRSLHG